jgi:Prokaryotic Cytochrome C oxidase subunit IV
VTVAALVNKRLFVAWLVLTAITLLYFWIDRPGNSSGARTASIVVTVSAICLALVKVRIIMRQFMEVRDAPLLLRRLTDFWIALMAVALLASYFAGRYLA